MFLEVFKLYGSPMRGTFCNLDDPDDLLCLFLSRGHAQRLLGRLVRTVAPLGMPFESYKYKMWLIDGTSVAPSFDTRQGKIVNRFSCVTKDYSIAVDVSKPKSKARAAEALLKHFWHLPVISLMLKAVYFAAMFCSVVCLGDMKPAFRIFRRLKIYDHRWSPSVFRIRFFIA